MATAGFFALMDDIATLLDDVSLMTKAAAKKTAGIVGDDLAVNTEQVSGVKVNRELPVVWAVAKGSLLNKVILVPFALLISALLPWLVTPLLILGGLYLCFEGLEKLTHKWLHSEEDLQQHHQNMTQALANTELDIALFEKEKIKAAIRTDFILSAEIIIIILGVVQDEGILLQSLVVSLVAFGVTVVVYGLVAAIVKFDDLGLALLKSKGASGWHRFKQTAGRLILMMAPKLMQLLSVIGMVAMFLVGGGILVHGLPFLHHLLDNNLHESTWLSMLLSLLLTALIGVITGAVVLAGVTLAQHFKVGQG